MSTVRSWESKKDAANHKASPSPHTILWDALPAWQRDNCSIRSGYRPASGSFWKSITSLLYLHNETVNIYSHLLAAAAYAIVGLLWWKSLGQRSESADTQDIGVFACFFLGAMACLGMSATYHLISNHSESIARLGNKLDYLGIVFLIWGSFIPSISYGFSCDPALIKTYWSMISTIGAGCAITSTATKFRSPAWRPFRAGMFVAMGLSAVIPVFHGLQLYGLRRMNSLMGLPWLVLQGSLYMLGAAIYAARVPERFAPGYFDIWGSSHQLFHVLVVLAATSHLQGLLKAFEYRHTQLLSSRCF